MDEVYLYKVGRNLNRAIRTCEAFGVNRVFTVQCQGLVKGNLFKASGRVNLIGVDSLPIDDKSLYFETDGNILVDDIDFTKYSRFCFGGESNDLPKKNKVTRVKIPQVGEVSGLTVEAALAIVLYLNQRVKNG